MVKTYAVIGDPIDHTLSPNIHNAAFKKLEMDATYIAYKIAKGELAEGIESLKKIKISGFNVTIPHKVEITRYLDKMDQNCSVIGASNTVAYENGELKGYNTDLEGFLEPIKKRDIKMENSKVLLLGAGGAARAIVTAFRKEKCNQITIANRTSENAKELSEFSEKIGIDVQTIPLDEINESKNKFDFIINATSIGLKNESTPISKKILSSDVVVYDIVYRPMNTDLIKVAKESGAIVIYGYEMLLEQAIRSFEIWHGIKAPYDVMKKALLGVA
jgi:shikimate dehydrogenase